MEREAIENADGLKEKLAHKKALRTNIKESFDKQLLHLIEPYKELSTTRQKELKDKLCDFIADLLLPQHKL